MWGIVGNSLFRVVGNLFNDDFRDFIAALERHEVRYLLIGGYAVIAHGYDRSTGDMDVWVECTPENYGRLVTAFRAFGMPVFDMTLERFLDVDRYDVFGYGVPPNRIELLTAPAGVEFAACYPNRRRFVDGDLECNLIGYDDLLAMKRAAGRLRDRDDLENLGG